AKSFEKNGYSMVIEEENLDPQILLEKLDELYLNREKYVNDMDKSDVKNSIDKIIELIETYKKP
ncbi:MAG TPA: UDP-N-acetylglucosamine--N-acetylmuramyl-(pentapeptide) pyrophosphoryl-undecaprenol N-acetylglucosamine transferase, partial [Clostridium sp.]|nr:UDP-N-acetylglucosamine--N-acetylmuramyl-(pentapeptide) pyrophosphoryl-undecaprenol N-acetylglucosamine transferase [Clostridium sp.]